MSSRTINVDETVNDYIRSVSVRETPVQSALRKATAALPESMMQISPEQGQFMSVLVKLTGARNCLEIGTFTGYSALCVALALPPDGRLVACDISTEYTDVGLPFWQEAGVRDKIDLRIGPALDSLDEMIANGAAGSFDFAFIDADKLNYTHYVDRCHSLVRKGGVIAIDNVLWGGSVADPSDQKPDTVAIRTMNSSLKDDPRFDPSLVPIGDGVTLLHKR